MNIARYHFSLSVQWCQVYQVKPWLWWSHHDRIFPTAPKVMAVWTSVLPLTEPIENAGTVPSNATQEQCHQRGATSLYHLTLVHSTLHHLTLLPINNSTSQHFYISTFPHNNIAPYLTLQHSHATQPKMQQNTITTQSHKKNTTHIFCGVGFVSVLQLGYRWWCRIIECAAAKTSVVV